MRRVNIVIDEETERGIKSLGGGNLSAGIRAAWQMLKGILPHKRQKHPDPP